MESRLLYSTILVMFSLCVFSQANWDNTSFVHRDGRLIKDGQNNAIQLEGMNLGGWLMWEGWIWNGNFTQQKTIFNTLETELGTTAANNFRDSVYWNYITKKDIEDISEECFNVVRIPINHKLLEDDFTPYIYKEKGWEVLDSVLSWCEQYNVYAVLDLHSAPGGQSNLFTADPDIFINLWNGVVNQTRTANLWKAIADRYKDRGIIAGYDLLNEPDPTSEMDMLNLYKRITDSIRTVDNNHMLFIEGSNLSSDFSVFDALVDNNMTYEFHLYTWFINDIEAEVLNHTALSEAQNVPIWCGEWGENTFDELDTTIKVFRNPDFGISGSAFWTWKKVERVGTYPDYFTVESTPLWNKTIQWIGNSFAPKPSKAEMEMGIAEFIHNMKWMNGEINDTLSNILKFCTSSSIDLLQTNNVCLAFPNPTTGDITIDLDKTYNRVLVNVRNISGQLINTEIFHSTNSLPIIIIGSSGLYFVEVVFPNSKSSIKVMKH